MGPKLLPKKKAKPGRVYLDPDLWDELERAATFHSAVFEEMGADEKVSRNDIIESHLRWSMKEYWDGVGGEPTSDEDFKRKVKRYAELLKKAGEE